jgi:hypothetical protein
MKGSQLQIQIYVNRRREELNGAVATKISEFDPSNITWVSPLEGQRFVELRDDAFLEALGLGRLREELHDYWPRGGPVWDALATVDGAGRDDVLLVEGKSHVKELRSACKASEPALTMIRRRLEETREWVDASGELNPWLTQYYQLANRIAHLRFLRLHRVDAWLVLLSFSDDVDHVSATREELEASIKTAGDALGFDLLSHPHIVHAVLASRPRKDLTG